MGFTVHTVRRESDQLAGHPLDGGILILCHCGSPIAVTYASRTEPGEWSISIVKRRKDPRTGESRLDQAASVHLNPTGRGPLRCRRKHTTTISGRDLIARSERAEEHGMPELKLPK